MSCAPIASTNVHSVRPKLSHEHQQRTYYEKLFATAITSQWLAALQRAHAENHATRAFVYLYQDRLMGLLSQFTRINELTYKELRALNLDARAFLDDIYSLAQQRQLWQHCVYKWRLY